MLGKQAHADSANPPGSNGPPNHIHRASHAVAMAINAVSGNAHAQELAEGALTGVEDPQVAVVADGREERGGRARRCADDERHRRQA